MKALLIDHEDSFTQNICTWLSEHFNVTTVSFQATQVIETHLRSNDFNLIVFSPGPKHPNDYPSSLKLISDINSSQAILGICLGMQMMFTAEGLPVIHAQYPLHGKTSILKSTDTLCKQFNGIKVGRYHSLIVTPGTPFLNLAVAQDDQSLQWALHKTKKWMGVQFHPESFLTEKKELMLSFISNWVKTNA